MLPICNVQLTAKFNSSVLIAECSIETTALTFNPALFSSANQSRVSCACIAAETLFAMKYTTGCFQCPVTPETMPTKASVARLSPASGNAAPYYNYFLSFLVKCQPLNCTEFGLDNPTWDIDLRLN